MVSILDESVGIKCSLLESKAVQDVTPERWHLLSVDSLHGAGPGLGVLTSHAADANHTLVGAPNEYQTHLEKKLNLGLDDILLAVVEELSAVAALEEEGVATGHIPQKFFEADDLAGMDDRGQPFELRDGLGESFLVWIIGALLDGLGPPRLRGPLGRLPVACGGNC